VHAGEIKGNGHAEVVNREKLRGGHACMQGHGEKAVYFFSLPIVA
jgi:hypothetical protein